MIPRSFLVPLVVGLPVLVTAFTVVMGGYLVLRLGDDEGAAAVFRWLGVACLLLLAFDLLLLVGLLGFNALGPIPRSEPLAEPEEVDE